jgi:hypothetical protein
MENARHQSIKVKANVNMAPDIVKRCQLSTTEEGNFFYEFPPIFQNNWHHWGHAVALWLRHYATSRKVVGWSPDKVDVFNLSNPSSHTNGPGVDSASNRNQHQESSWGVTGSWRIRLTTLLPSVSRLSRQNVGASTSHNPMGLHSLLQG